MIVRDGGLSSVNRLMTGKGRSVQALLENRLAQREDKVEGSYRIIENVYSS